jgi:hypothetical protein
MPELRFFLDPHELFDLLRQQHGKQQLTMVLQRFQSEAGPAGWHIARADEPLAELYTAGGYELLYLSLGATPEHATDWQFTERAMDELLELTGGRQSGNLLELATLRVFAKRSRATKVFYSIRRSIKSLAAPGVLVARGTRYPDIVHSARAAKFKLVHGLSAPDVVFEIES